LENSNEFKIVEKMALDLFIKERGNTIKENLTYKITSVLGVFDVEIEKVTEDKWRLKSYKKIS